MTKFSDQVRHYAIECMKLDNEYASLIECEAGDAEVDFDRASQVVEQKAVICELARRDPAGSLGAQGRARGRVLAPPSRSRVASSTVSGDPRSARHLLSPRAGQEPDPKARRRTSLQSPRPTQPS